ncbi:MAG: anaerobic ribonucleoside-triphosphate reductase activating protein [Lachnospiraceae bacterium]|nr:anaerobic ribonucleoside-triphosphate reductase activating protein [Lachnospiraceae bacterium]
MQIHGLSKLTLLDYPGHTAATIFTGGCNMRCPYCHNMELVLHPETYPSIAEEEVLDFLKKRIGILQGVCITGGEATLQPDLGDFIRKIRELGFLVKLDTNGYRPEVLKQFLEDGILNYVAMDIKNSREKYAQTVGLPKMDISRIEESVELLINSTIDYEFRTTVIREMHEKEDFEAMGEWIRGAKAYYLQSFVESEGVLCPGFSPWDKEHLEEFAELVKKYVPNVSVRGV